MIERDGPSSAVPLYTCSKERMGELACLALHNDYRGESAASVVGLSNQGTQPAPGPVDSCHHPDLTLVPGAGFEPASGRFARGAEPPITPNVPPRYNQATQALARLTGVPAGLYGSSCGWFPELFDQTQDGLTAPALFLADVVVDIEVILSDSSTRSRNASRFHQLPEVSGSRNNSSMPV